MQLLFNKQANDRPSHFGAKWRNTKRTRHGSEETESSSAYLGSDEEDLVADGGDAAGRHGEGDAREDVGVVALARVERLAFVPERRERAAAGKDALALETCGCDTTKTQTTARARPLGL